VPGSPATAEDCRGKPLETVVVSAVSGPHKAPGSLSQQVSRMAANREVGKLASLQEMSDSMEKEKKIYFI
jgi:NADPH-dependent curcumin reductase CurA